MLIDIIFEKTLGLAEGFFVPSEPIRKVDPSLSTAYCYSRYSL